MRSDRFPGNMGFALSHFIGEAYLSSGGCRQEREKQGCQHCWSTVPALWDQSRAAEAGRHWAWCCCTRSSWRTLPGEKQSLFLLQLEGAAEEMPAVHLADDRVVGNSMGLWLQQPNTLKAGPSVHLVAPSEVLARSVCEAAPSSTDSPGMCRAHLEARPCHWVGMPVCCLRCRKLPENTVCFPVLEVPGHC